MTEPGTIDWLECDSPWSFQPGRLRAIQPPGVSGDEFSQRARREQWARPYIFETPFERRMHFTNLATQSAMLLSDPDALIAQYTRKMMAFLLFKPVPESILMIGLGGGSLAKFCYRHLPRAQITVVEIDAEVIALREEFLVPKDDERFRVIHDDGAPYLERLTRRMDVLLIDAFDADGIALSLASSGFYACAARQLSDEGVLVMNFWGPRERYVENLAQARAAFGDHLLLVPVSGESNVLLFAFKRPPPKSISEELDRIATRLQARLALDFPRYLRRVCQGYPLTDPARDFAASEPGQPFEA